MKVFGKLGCAFIGIATLARIGLAQGPKPASAADIVSSLHALSLDPSRTYHVRDVSLAKGDLKLYLNEGVLSFFAPVDGRFLAAYFTTEGTEMGDAEVMLLPPNASERTSLARFTKSPNLDEHFDTALFFFTDDTAAQILGQIERGPVRAAPELAGTLNERASSIARNLAGQLAVSLTGAVLDRHSDATGYFYGVIGGRTLGIFDVAYHPLEEESNFAGQAAGGASKEFRLWTNFRPRRAPPYQPPPPAIGTYRITAAINADLSMQCLADFDLRANAEQGRVLEFEISPHFRVHSATVDGKPVEVLQRPPRPSMEPSGVEKFLLVAAEPLGTEAPHRVQVEYTGGHIRKTPEGIYFVDDRTAWYPEEDSTSAIFDLTFRLPGRLGLVATGDLVSDTVQDGIRTVHRRTQSAVPLAGFNLGEFSVQTGRQDGYAIELDSPAVGENVTAADPALLERADHILHEYLKRWTPLPCRSLAIAPIAGAFGQGFPGLIYLSSVAYLKQESRAAVYRDRRSDDFFSELLIPHELAHQWWGDLVRQANYRSAWIVEAMANDAALEYIAQTDGAAARDEILATYRRDLEREENGQTIESAGPVNFGERLISNFNFETWQIVLYEKGSWIMRMLRERLGDGNFRKLQLAMLAQYAARPLTNEDFRKLASQFVPPGVLDRTLEEFFDTWVYGTGVPALSLETSGRLMTINVSNVPDDFSLTIRLKCKGLGPQWVKVSGGENSLPVPRGASSCELPSPRDTLYLAGRK